MVLYSDTSSTLAISTIKDTIGLMQIVSDLFSFYRAIFLILGINFLILAGVALFSLPVLKTGN